MWYYKERTLLLIAVIFCVLTFAVVSAQEHVAPLQPTPQGPAALIVCPVNGNYLIPVVAEFTYVELVDGCLIEVARADRSLPVCEGELAASYFSAAVFQHAAPSTTGICRAWSVEFDEETRHYRPYEEVFTYCLDGQKPLVIDNQATCPPAAED